MFKSLLVLESPWDNKRIPSVSVWPFVSGFANVLGVKAYHQTFLNQASFCHWVSLYNKEKMAGDKLLYVAAHGSGGRIATLRKGMNGATIISALKKAKSISYVHFGSCLFGSDENLTALLTAAKHLKWAAGYGSSVDWIDSTAFDLLVWGRLAERSEGEAGKHFHTVARRLLLQTKGLAKELEFRFQYRWGGDIWTMSMNDRSPTAK